MTETRIFYRQVRALTIGNLKSRYRKTFAGFLWVVLNPLMLFSAQALVFNLFLKIEISNYFLFLGSGLVPWIFISQTLEMSTPVLVASGQLMKSFKASPLIYLSAQVSDNLINFIAGLSIAILPIWWFQSGFSWHIVLLPLPLLSLALGVFGLAWLLATAQVFLRDTRFLVSFALQIGYFLTPIFYPREFVPSHLQWLITLNPIFHLIAPFQILIHDFSASAFFEALTWSFFSSVVIVTLAAWNWSRRRNAVYFYV